MYAEKGRENIRPPQKEENSYVKATIERDAKIIYEEIKRLTIKGIHSRTFNAHPYSFPKRVADYISEEFGCIAEYVSTTHAIKITW